jgi:hypothetical protein
MIRNLWNRKQLVFTAAIVLLACTVAALAVGLVYPGPVTAGALGPDWQCSRLAFVFTICSRVAQVRPAVTSARKIVPCWRRV